MQGVTQWRIVDGAEAVEKSHQASVAELQVESDSDGSSDPGGRR